MRRTATLTLLADWLPKLVAFATVVVLARRLGAPAFAEFALALGWIGYAWWGVDLGQAGYSIRTLAGAEQSLQRRLGSEILSLYLALSLVVTLLLTTGLVLLTDVVDGTGRLVLAMSPYLLCYAAFPDWWLRARGMLGTLATANWACALTFLGAVTLLPTSSTADALAFGLSPLPGAAVTLLALARAGQTPRWCGRRRAWVEHLRTSLLFCASGAGGQLATPLALASMTAASPASAGAFALGLRASGAAANALWLLLHNALPRLLASGRRPRPREVLLAALPPALGVAVASVAWPLLQSVVGPTYAGHGAYVALGAVLLVVWGPKYVVEIALIAEFGDRRRIVMNLVTPAVIVVALALGLPHRGAWTVAVTLLLGEALAAAVGVGLLGRGRPAPVADQPGRVSAGRT